MQRVNSLLEDLAIGPLVGLAVGLDGLIPAPLVLEEFLVLGLGGVELGELIGLPIWSDIESGHSLVATDEESTTDDGVVVLAVDGGGTEDVLAGSLKTGEEATDEVGAHESESQLIVVLVVDTPQGVLLGLVVLPEPGKGNGAGVLVGVLALPVIKDERRLAKRLKRVLGLGGSRSFLLLDGRSNRGGSGSGDSSRRRLLGLFLLLGGSVLDSLLDLLSLRDDGSENRLAADQVEPAGEVREFLTERLVEDILEATNGQGGDEEIGESDALGDEEGVEEEVRVDDTNGLAGASSSLINVLLVVGHATDQREEPLSNLGEDLGVGERHPAEDLGVIALGLAEKSGLIVLGGDCDVLACCRVYIFVFGKLE